MYRFMVALVVVAAAGVLLAESPSEQTTVVMDLTREEWNTASRIRTFTLNPGQTFVVRDLDLDDTVEGAAIEVIGESEYTLHRLQVQYETSVTVMNDGPHMDLVDWKHYTSPWIDLECPFHGDCRIPTFSAEERSRFPEITTSEFVQAVEAQGGERWAGLVRTLSRIGDEPTGIDISLIRIRLVSERSADLDPILTLEFVIPMGC